MDSCRYIFSHGDLLRQDNSITIRIDGKPHYLPSQHIKELYLFEECTITTKLLDMFSKTETVVHFFNYFGNYYGSFIPKKNHISGELTVKQSICYSDNIKRLTIAKAIVLGISKNIYFLVYHYYRHGKKNVKPYIDFLRKDVEHILNKCENIKQILALEGNIWSGFFETFQYYLPEDFLFNKRVRRPPDNPMNALISFGNMFLYTKTINEIYQTHLNQSISFLHEPSDGRFSLCLDLSEVFKPIIVFQTIFALVNNKKIQVEKHFDKQLNYCLLNEDGKKIFVQSLDEKLKETFLNTTLNRKMTYQHAIKLDGFKLIKFIMEQKEFVPFSMEDKR